jgi:hypothetical protein
LGATGFASAIEVQDFPNLNLSNALTVFEKLPKFYVQTQLGF